MRVTVSSVKASGTLGIDSFSGVIEYASLPRGESVQRDGNQLELVAVEQRAARALTVWIAPHGKRGRDDGVIVSDVDVELDGVDEERRRRVVLEVDGFGLRFSHGMNVPQSDAPEHARAPAECDFRALHSRFPGEAVGTRFAE